MSAIQISAWALKPCPKLRRLAGAAYVSALAAMLYYDWIAVGFYLLIWTAFVFSYGLVSTRWLAKGNQTDGEASMSDEEKLTAWKIIDALREGEGSSVTICSENPDFNGSNSCVLICDWWTGWTDQRFEGASVLDALNKALEARDKTACETTA